MSLAYLGVEDYDVGFDLSSIGPIAQGLGTATQGIITEVEKDKAAKATAADQERALSNAKAADVKLATALAKVDMATQGKWKTLEVDKIALKSAEDQQRSAGSGLSGDSHTKRIQAAQEAHDKAVSAAQGKPDAQGKANLTAWATVLEKVKNSQIVQQDSASPATTTDSGSSSEGFSLNYKIGGVVPVWGAGAGVLGLGVLGYFLKRRS